MSDSITLAPETPAAADRRPVTAITLKRSITVKSLVTPAFRERAKKELSQETQIIQQQIEQLDLQFQQTLKQLEQAAREGHNVSRQMDQLHRDVQQRRAQLEHLKQEVQNQLANLDNVTEGSYVTTGQLENWVELKVGDEIYKKLRDAEILVKDGVVTAILEG